MKKLIAAVLFLLLLAAPVFGTDFIWDGGGGDANWSTAANWDLGASYPGELTADGTDTAEFNNVVSTACTLDVSPAYALSDFTMQTGNPSTAYDGTLTMGSETLDVDGPCELAGTLAATAATIECSGNYIAKVGLDAALPSGLTIELNGTGTSTTQSTGGGALVINTAGTITLGGDNYWDSWTINGGTLDYDSNDLYIVGNIQRTGNVTLSNQGTTTITGTAADCYHDTSTSYRVIDDLAVTGTMTIRNASYFTVEKLTIGDGATVTDGAGNGYLYIREPPDNFWSQHANGTVSCVVQLYSTTGTETTGGAMAVTGDIRIMAGAWLADGAITITSGDMDIMADWGATSLDMGANALGCVNVIVSDDASNNGSIDFGTGTHTVTGNISDGSLAGGTNTIEFSTSNITLTGTLDGDSITCQSDASGSHSIIHGGTVTNVDFSSVAEALDATDNCTNGGNDFNVWFPGVMAAHMIFGGGMIGSGEAK